MSSLIEDVRDSFKSKGLEFVSITESSSDPNKSTLTYKDASGRTLKKDVSIALSELEDTVAGLDAMDPGDLAEFLLDEK